MHRTASLRTPSILATFAVTTFACTAHAQSNGAAQGDTPPAVPSAEPMKLDVAPPAKPPESRRSVVPAVVLAVLAAGGIGSGIWFTAAWSSNTSDAATLRAYITARHGTCIPNVGGYDAKCPQLQAKLRASVTYGDAAVGTFIVGGGAAVGAALYLLWPSPRPTIPRPFALRDIRLTPMLGATNGLLLTGRF